ncbi:uncharacterized protein LOC135809070 [Sycon ciliatum]|uniref:uncharacterized protein LOC135809070 n=1 Tax=Sycon ciliatum TaxID=27933 RepID=UPI0031F70FDB
MTDSSGSGIIVHTADQYHTQQAAATYYQSCVAPSLSMPPMTYEGGAHPHLVPPPGQVPIQAYHTYCPTFHPREPDMPVLDANQHKQDYTTVLPAMHLMTPVTTFVSPATGLATPQHHTAIPIASSHHGNGMSDIRNDMQRPTNLPMDMPACASSSPVARSATYISQVTPTPMSSHTMPSPFSGTAASKPARADFHKSINDMNFPTPGSCDSHKTPGAQMKGHQQSMPTSRAAAAASVSSSTTRSHRSPSTSQSSSAARMNRKSSPTSRHSKQSPSAKRPSACTAQPSRCLPKQAKVILREWLESNLEYPYPSDSEKQKLANLASITALQVSYWFVNARRRLLPRLLDDANHQRAARNEPPIQIHPCARFSESFRPPHMKCDLPSPTNSVRKPKDMAQLRSPATGLHPPKDIAVFSPPLHAYEAAPHLILSHPQIVTQQQQQPQQPQQPQQQLHDGSDSSSDSSSYTWPRQSRSSIVQATPGLYPAAGVTAHQPIVNVAMASTVLSPSVAGRLPGTSASSLAAGVSKDQYGLATVVTSSPSPREYMQKMPPPTFAFSQCDKPAGQQLDSSCSSIQSPPFLQQQQQQQPQQYCQHPTTIQSTIPEQGSKEETAGMNGLSPPITPSVTSPESVAAVPPQPQFLFPSTMSMVQAGTSTLPSLYTSHLRSPPMLQQGQTIGSYTSC